MTSPEAARDPDGWIMELHEVSGLFLHWPVSPDAVRDLVPAHLELDRYEGTAWVSISPHRIEKATLRDVPPIPHLDTFPEVELRTYVRHEGVPGVWFFSFDAPGHLGNWLRHHAFHLPYCSADVTIESSPSETHATSRRDESGARFEATYHPVGPASPAPAGSLEGFLIERYSMFVVGPDGAWFRGDVEHEPWPLQPVDFDLKVNTLAEAARLPSLGEPALSGYAAGIVSRYWALQHLVD